MTEPTRLLVDALRVTAARLSAPGVRYQWAHFGRCNCGHLAQTVTRLSPDALQRAAEKRRGDWAEQAIRWQSTDAASAARAVSHSLPDFGDRPALDEGAWEPEPAERCSATEIPMEEVFAQLATLGLTATDLVHLERLSDPRVRRSLGTNTVDFHYSHRDNVVRYLYAWADLLEAEMPPSAPPSTEPAEVYLAAAE